ncbi:ABC transporter ATP-binding protein [Paenarthrobacter sp. Z7-10]|uniref:ABC transporter ATP-binding protein n=1 Tax=Paenarthrobacter sp. Z7-10 TaxID=2787635 RepID=UPI0022A9E8C8|nr:ABC transporter ATP-binding protein [Paenarthrobacter sp. Z7-10]MCZ2404401.1 ABC transporter ATP-binding protein [Paenarthrobacter sp. Z7-10]
MSVITAEAVTKSYRGRTLYRDVNFDVPEGTITSITGPNGSGKSVLFRLICGFTSPDKGTISIAPKYMSAGRTFPERFGVLIDRPGYLAGKTGLQNLQYLARIRGVIDDNKITATMEQVGLDPALPQRVRHYSLGMKQKLALAQALMEDPAVLVLDEPFNALDADSSASIKDHLRLLNQSGVTIIFTSHNPLDVDELADRRLVIDGDQIRCAYSATDLTPKRLE